MRKKKEAENEQKKLGEAERKILASAQEILFTELAISLNTTYEAIDKEVNRYLSKS